jgi:alpha-ketoglutarate-dependent taurine dioxygenase
VEDPFDLSRNAPYMAWKTRKLEAYPAEVADLRVSVGQLDRPTARERAALCEKIGTVNMALVQTDPAGIDKATLLSFTRSIGLERTDANLFADASAVSSITATPITPGDARRSSDDASGAMRLGDFIPYTNRPLSWHTDGYYNAPDAQVRSWCLFCVRAARDGGENRLMDHEMAYIRLRDESPHHIAALSHPCALVIPAHMQAGQTIRPESVGPVFSCRDGHLHMRYSARGRNVLWRDTPETDAAREALDRLFSHPDVFTFRYRLRPGEGVVSNNVLHSRSGFEDESDPAKGRLLYRVRFLDRIAID